MNSKNLFLQIILAFTFFNTYSSQNKLESNNSYYYDEKYFRLLTNNYNEINPGNFWKNLYSDGIGFKSIKDFGSIILLKDWAMYNFKLTQIFFRKNCTFEYEDFNCLAEMWLYHTRDNQYYPPGRRIYIKQNVFIIVIPFVLSNNENPANDLIFDFFNLEGFKNSLDKANAKISPKKPIKLHQIIQNQPSYLFNGKYNDIDTLFMVFTQYHFISENMLSNLDYISQRTNDINTIVTDFGKIYRNIRKLEEIKPKATLLAYSKGSYLKKIFAFIILFLF
jgi:hypothetical protein